METDRLMEIYRKSSNDLFELNEKRKHFDSFFDFHKATGLGRIYNEIYRKYNICLKFIYKNPIY